MYRLTVQIPNPPLLITRTFDFATKAEADAAQDHAAAKGLSSVMRKVPLTSLADAIRQINEELNLAAEHRVI